MLIDIQSMFKDIIETPQQRRAAMQAQGEQQAQTAVGSLSGAGKLLAPLIAQMARQQPERSEALQRGLGGMFSAIPGVERETRTPSQQLQAVLSESSTETPADIQALAGRLRDMGYGDQALALEQQGAEQARVAEASALGARESEAQIKQLEANTARLNAERIKITAETNPSAARTALSTTILDNKLILTVDEKGNTTVSGFDGKVYEGEAANEAIAEAQQNELERRRQMAQVAASGTISAGLAKESFDLLGGISSALVQYAGAIDAIDDGALTGYLQRMLPTFRESTVRLEQIQTEMGLGVISMTTFGALSEKELNLAIAVNAPNLPPAELRQWYQDKIAATRKLQREVEKQAIYFSSPSASVGGWLERQQVERERRETTEEFQSTTDAPVSENNEERQAKIDRMAARAQENTTPSRQTRRGAR